MVKSSFVKRFMSRKYPNAVFPRLFLAPIRTIPSVCFFWCIFLGVGCFMGDHYGPVHIEIPGLDIQKQVKYFYLNEVQRMENFTPDNLCEPLEGFEVWYDQFLSKVLSQVDRKSFAIHRTIVLQINQYGTVIDYHIVEQNYKEQNEQLATILSQHLAQFVPCFYLGKAIVTYVHIPIVLSEK